MKKSLKLFGLGGIAAVLMTLVAAITLGGVSTEPVLHPGKDTAKVQKVISEAEGGCTIIFSLDGHAVEIKEPATEKCDSYTPGQKVTF
jgi:hypothetical protein